MWHDTTLKTDKVRKALFHFFDEEHTEKAMAMLKEPRIILAAGAVVQTAFRDAARHMQKHSAFEILDMTFDVQLPSEDGMTGAYTVKGVRLFTSFTRALFPDRLPQYMMQSRSGYATTVLRPSRARPGTYNE